MKTNHKWIWLLLLFFGSACVQKTYRKTVVFTLNTENCKDIKTVGLRGVGAPLSWDSDTLLSPIKKDSLYRIIVSATTGYKFVEVKFTVNGEFELKEKPNRRVEFAEGDTTYYEAVFDAR